jgi:glyoxylase-like metal-dependent hydrolase (beta-lactamase superfamily II)
MKNKVVFLILTIMANISCQSQNFSTCVGDYKVFLLSEGQQQGNTGILIGATPEMIKEQAPNGTFPNATNAFLLQMPDKNILVDTGYGRLLLDNLKSLHVSADQIDIVLITHMHGDHIGGLLKDNEKVFPKARIYISQQEYDYWSKTDNLLVINVLKSYEEQLVLFEPNMLENLSASLFPGIIPIATYGHTPGHTSFLIESKDAQLLIWGDLTHAMAVQMPYPQVAVTYDVNPEEAAQSRQAILKYVSENDIPIAGMHIAYPAMGKIKPVQGKGYEFIPFPLK